jgi:Undecaprenyl-phosphate glucose phosphotransferase
MLEHATQHLAEPHVEAPFAPTSLAYRLCKLCSPAVAADLALLLNAATIVALAVISHAAYYSFVLQSGPMPADYAIIGFAVALVYLFTARFVFHLDFEALQQGLDSGSQSVKALLVAATIFLAAVFLAKTTDVHSRGWFVAWMIGAALALMLQHVAVAKLLERAVLLPGSPYRRRVALFGTPPLAAAFTTFLRRRRDGRTSLVHSATVLPDVPEPAFERAVAHFVAFCRHHPVSEVVVALPWADETRILATVRAFAALPVDVRLAPDQAGYALAQHQLLAGSPLPLVTVSVRPIRDWGKLVKELFDRSAAILLLAFLAPLFVVVALAIKLDSPGPVFFRQERNGFNHRTFWMWKFRSMSAGADRPGPGGGFRQATRDDPRVTRVGSIIRRTSIDELPQLINVVKGEMSLVGPRPHPVALDDHYMALIDQYASRHAVLPGITGWAQVNGYRGETDTESKMAGRIAHDLHYIRNWSFALDFWILLLTVIRGFVHKNAY